MFIPVFSLNDVLEEYCYRFFDKLNNETRLPDDEIMRRAQEYLLSDKVKEEVKKEEPKEKIVKVEKVTIKKTPPSYLTPNALKVYELIGNEPIHVDEITNICKLSTEATLSALTELEIYGLITQISGRRYKIN